MTQLPRLTAVLMSVLLVTACSQSSPTSPSAANAGLVGATTQLGEQGGDGGSRSGLVDASCWGQASAVFAAMEDDPTVAGDFPGNAMGEHSASFGNPRAGLRNLARDLADAGIIPDGSMASLGQFVADALGLEIDACM